MNNWCFKVMPAVKTFKEADQTCKNDGAILASIHSVNENNFLLQYKTNLLIGLQYSNQAGGFTWIDGTNVDYSNWHADYPKDKDYFGLCAQFESSGTWINAECDYLNLQFVCKKAKANPPVGCPAQTAYTDLGEITSPGYPGNYPNGLSCIYDLIGKNGLTVTLEMIEATMSATDYIELHSGLDSTGHLLAVFQGDLTGQRVYTTPEGQNMMRVIFVSKSAQGVWKFKWHSNNVATCPQAPNNVFHDSGEISSPGYPSNYPNGLTCTYDLLGKNGFTVTLEMIEAPTPVEDSIMLFSGLVSQGNPLAVFQGDHTGQPMSYTTPSNENKMRVVFTSHSNTGSTWKFRWHANDPSQPTYVCPQSDQFYESGEVKSPGYPNNYGSGLSCAYHLYTDPGYSIKIELLNVVLGGTDTIEIYDGDVMNNANLIATVRDDMMQPTYTSSDGQNKILLRFRSQQSIGYWRLRFSSMGFNRCPQKTTYVDGGTFATVGYPYGYGLSLTCVYYLSVTKAPTMNINFGLVDIDPVGDWIEIYEGHGISGSYAKRITRNVNVAQTYQSKGNQVTVRFLMGYPHDSSLTGWSATFSPATRCPVGYISSNLGHCYKLHDTQVHSFNSAEQQCMNEGAHLVSIDNGFQNAIVLNMLNPKQWLFWIGLRYIGGNWIWTDGTQTQYTNWALGQPLHQNGDCVGIDGNGKWEMMRCDVTLPFVCYKL